MKPRSAPWSLAWVVLLAGCPGGSVPAADAGDAGADSDGWSFDVEPPDPPAPPVLTPCPEGWREVPPAEPDGVTTCDPWPDGDPVVMTPCPAGWREVTDPESGTVTCDPWPEGGPHECAADEAHFPGEPGCTRIGTPCPAGDWAEDLPTDRPILYVRAGAPSGGEGTRESPFGTIAEAMAVATSGTVIALGKGAFDEAVRLSEGVTLWGACAAETLVTCSAPAETAGTVTVMGTETAVRNLHVSGARPGFWVGGRRSLHLEDVLVAGSRTLGLYAAAGATVDGRSIVIRDTQSRESDLQRGRAIGAQDGARVAVTRAVFERNRDAAVMAFDAGTTVTLSDVVARDTRSRESDGLGGRAILAQGGARVEATRAVFERNREEGVVASHAGTMVTLVDVVVSDTQSLASDRKGGRAILAQGGARVEATRAVLQSNRDVAVVARDAGTTVTLSDVVVRDTQSRESDRKFGRAINAAHGARVEVTRAVFERNRDVAVIAFDAGTTVTLTDVIVRDTQSRESDGLGGRAISVLDGARVEATRAVLERNRDVAVMAGRAGPTVTLSDVVVRDTQSRESDRQFGRALGAQDGARVEVTRSVLERNRDVAVLASGVDTTVMLADVVVRDTQGRESDGQSGSAINAQRGAQVEVTRAVLERSRDVAVVAFRAGTTVTLSDVVVRDTRAWEADGFFGHGVGAYGGGHVEMTRFVVSRSARCGLQLAHGEDEDGVDYPEGGTMDLHEGVVEQNVTCGANVQTAGFNLRRLMHRVIYRDNPMDLDSSEMPVPDPSVPSAEPEP